MALSRSDRIRSRVAARKLTRRQAMSRVGGLVAAALVGESAQTAVAQDASPVAATPVTNAGDWLFTVSFQNRHPDAIV